LPGGRSLLIACGDTLQLWDLEGPTLQMQLPLQAGWLTADEIRAVCPSTDGRLALAGCHFSQGLRLVNLELAEAVRAFSGPGSGLASFRRGAVVAVAFSPEGVRCLSGSWDQMARVWNVLTGEELCCFRGHTGFWGWRGVVGVAWLDGERVVSASEDGSLRVW